MEKIRLGSGKELELIVCGILADTKKVKMQIIPDEKSLDNLNTIFLDHSETKKMLLLSESGDELAVYNDYTQLESIRQEMQAVIGYEEDQNPVIGKLVTVVLYKPDRIEQRLTSLEDTVDTLVMESLGIEG